MELAIESAGENIAIIWKKAFIENEDKMTNKKLTKKLPASRLRWAKKKLIMIKGTMPSILNIASTIKEAKNSVEGWQNE